MSEAGRRRHKDGAENRRRILDAARQIAGERGYEGTSIALVSERSGLPASSIYWHFKDKDALLAAVIEESFARWLEGMEGELTLAGGQSGQEVLAALMRRTAKAILDSADFLRLGLMLTLERRPDERTARTLFLQARDETHRRMIETYRSLFPELDAEGCRHLATLTMAMADGLFIAYEASRDGIDFLGHFDALAAAVVAAARHLEASAGPHA